MRSVCADLEPHTHTSTEERKEDRRSTGGADIKFFGGAQGIVDAPTDLRDRAEPCAWLALHRRRVNDVPHPVATRDRC